MKTFKRLVCTDGFSMSVVAGKGNYCNPRNDTGPYSHVECGFPSEKEEILMKFAEDPKDPTGTVYGYVPTSVVLEAIERHGGWESGEMPPMVITE